MLACTAAQMREIDRRAVTEYGIPSLLLMENAARAVTERVWDYLPPAPAARSVLVLCGGGNNGGDGLAAARQLHCRGAEVSCLLFGRPRAPGDAALNLELAARFEVPVCDWTDEADLAARIVCAGVIVDALLGTGFSGPIREPYAAAIRALKGATQPVISVDIPSGLDADTGTAAGGAVAATETVTFGLPKVGLLLHPGRQLAGCLTISDISLPPDLLADAAPSYGWMTAAEARQLWPGRSAGAHKGDGGRMLIVAGSRGMVGAGVLAAEGALRAGAGLVTLAVPASQQAAAASLLAEVMTLGVSETPGGGHSPAAGDELLARAKVADAVVIGPGLGRDPETWRLVRRLLDTASGPFVLDADGLNLLAWSPAPLPPGCILTPHPGELARLLGCSITEVEADRLRAAESAARQFGCAVVLKGPGSVIASPGCRTWINASGSPALATGGTGDVLAGIAGAALARGLDPPTAARAAVYLHGLAGEWVARELGTVGGTAGDCARAIPQALRHLAGGS